MSSSKKKSKNNKNKSSREPLSNIMKEISNLKQELTTIKSKKQLATIYNIPNKTENRKLPLISFQQIGFRDRQAKLKITIQLNKLRKMVEKLEEGELISCQTNVILNIINIWIRQYERKFEVISKKLKKMECELEESYQDKMNEEVQKKKNKQLKSQIADLRHYTCLYAQLLKDNKKEVKKYVRESETLEKYNEELQRNNENLRKEISDLNNEKSQLAKEVRHIQTESQRKQHQLLELNEDLNFYKVQFDKQKEGKKNLQKELQIVQLNYEDEKLSKGKRIQQLQSMLSHLQTQLQENKKVIPQYHQLKLLISKHQVELQAAEQNLKAKDMQIKGLKEKLLGLEEEFLEQEQQMEKVQSENAQLQRNLSFCQQEIENLSQEINELRNSNERYKNQNLKNRIKYSQGEESLKSKTLADLKSLIKKHKSGEDEIDY